MVSGARSIQIEVPASLADFPEAEALTAWWPMKADWARRNGQLRYWWRTGASRMDKRPMPREAPQTWGEFGFPAS